MALSRGSSRAPIPLLAGFALFLAVIVYLLVSSLARPAVTTFNPTPARPRALDSARSRTDTLTVDARDAAAWRFVDFDRGSVVLPPDTAGWDLAFRRYSIIVAGAAADLGTIPFDDVARAPAGPYLPTIARRDTANPAFRRWYRYGMLSHLLEPKAHVYAVRTRGGRYAKLQIISYYCPGPTAGCPTVRYTYPLASGP